MHAVRRPVIAAVTCQDIKTSHMQQIVNAAPTAGEGDRVRGMVSALVTAGIDGGYLVNSRLAKVHWQAAGRPLPAPVVSVAGESAQWVDPAEIPSDGDISKLGWALAAGVRGDLYELMAQTARHRPPAHRAGYTVIPHSSLITGRSGASSRAAELIMTALYDRRQDVPSR